jgi:NAD(P)-dependent dehydrogenase (short-subunit alcohol dehydrogenase family)
MTLEDRVAIVTGANGPAGHAVAAALAAAGARLAAVGTRLDGLRSLAVELGLAEDRFMPIVADLRDAGRTRTAVDEVAAGFGRIDILAHLVGGWTGGRTVVETPESDFRSMLDQHLMTTLHVVQAVVPRMTAAGWGRIVAVSSPVATDHRPGVSAYAAGKAAEEAILGTLARELVGTGVTANVLQVRTIDAARERLSAPGPKNRSWTLPEEIAAAVVFLCGDGAAALNGARIPLTGAG